MTNVIHADLNWWLTSLRCFVALHFMAFAAWPWFTRLFSSRRDRGAGMAMAGGILVFQGASQLLWRTGFLEIHFVWFLLLVSCVGLSGYRLFFKPTKPSFGTRSRMRSAFVQGWFIFTLLFWYWAGIRAADPGVAHTEQPMNAMWMRAAESADQPPIRDAWYQGEPSTYYADGHQALSFLGVKFGLEIRESFNVTQIVWFALTGLLTFYAGKAFYALVYKKGGNLAGGLALLLVCFVSTPKGFWSALAPSTWWWWWDASRVLHDGETALITEFPFFSYWLGDNHAHLIALPYLLFAILSGITLLRCRKITIGQMLLPAVLVVWSWRTNSWQTPTVLAFPILCLILRRRKFSLYEWRAIGICLLVALIFLFPLRAPGPELSLAIQKGNHTNLWEFLQVFGFVSPGLIFLFIKPSHSLWLATTLLMLSMFICVEVVYLDDAFANRMNTLFKVYFQLWIFIGLLAAVGWAKILRFKGPFKALAILGLLACLLPGLVYASKLTWEASQVENKSLNAWSTYDRETQFLLELANRLVKSGDRIAEAPENSYGAQTSLLGTWTAGDTLIGWTGHQAQWRRKVEIPALWMLYEANSPEDLQAALETLAVDWVLWGPNEQLAFSADPEWASWMDDLAYRVVDQGDMKLFRVK